jgi:hypothetical protein
MYLKEPVKKRMQGDVKVAELEVLNILLHRIATNYQIVQKACNFVLRAVLFLSYVKDTVSTLWVC